MVSAVVAAALAVALSACAPPAPKPKKKETDGSTKAPDKTPEPADKTPQPPPDPPPPLEDLKYPEAAKTLETAAGRKVDKLHTSPTGLQYHVMVEGDGPPLRTGMVAQMHYTGWLVDGRKFDSSRDRSQPFPVALGAKRVIAGWEEGLLGMRMGGRRILVIPPSLGYGADGAAGVIPPNAVLVFDVEALK
jgi:hypothetical protein